MILKMGSPQLLCLPLKKWYNNWGRVTAGIGSRYAWKYAFINAERNICDEQESHFLRNVDMVGHPILNPTLNLFF